MTFIFPGQQAVLRLEVDQASYGGHYLGLNIDDESLFSLVLCSLIQPVEKAISLLLMCPSA